MTPANAHLVILLACSLWGSGNVAQKTILEHMGPIMAAGLTSLLGFLVLIPLALHEGRKAVTTAKPPILELLFTLLSFAGAITFLQIAYQGTSVSNAGFLVNTSTAMTPVAAWFILRETPSYAIFPCIFLVLIAVWLMGGASYTSLAWGDLVALLAAVFYALAIPLVSRYVLTYGRPAKLTCMQFFTCGVLCVILAFVLEPVSVSSIAKAWPELLMVGIVSKGIAYFLMAFAQQHTSAAATSILGTSEAIFGALFAALLLGERMTAMALTGASLILLSIILLNLLPQSWERRKVMTVLTHKKNSDPEA